MTRWVIDASALIKLFVEEEGSQDVAATIKPTDELFAPDLLWPEFANVLWKYARRGELTRENAAAVLGDALQMKIRIVSGDDLVETALSIAVATDRTVYDSFYLAVAIKEAGVLLTADSKLANALAMSPYARYIRQVVC